MTTSYLLLLNYNVTIISCPYAYKGRNFGSVQGRTHLLTTLVCMMNENDCTFMVSSNSIHSIKNRARFWSGNIGNPQASVAIYEYYIRLGF